MTLNQMQYFQMMCKYENYTKAAAELYISQPALSQAMRELEAECGLPLIVRKGNHLVITEAGRVLQAEIDTVLRQMGHLQESIHQMGLTRNYVRVGLSTFSGNTVFPKICHQYHCQYPDIVIRCTEDSTPNLFQLLDSGQVDLILTAPQSYSSWENLAKSYDFHCAKMSGLNFCVHRDHPLAARERISIGEILEEPLVMLNDRYAATKNLLSIFARYGKPPNVILYTTQMYTIERFVEQNAAAGFLPQEIAESNPNITGLHCDDTPARFVTLVWKKGNVLYPSIKKFISTTRKLFPEPEGFNPKIRGQ